MIAGAARRQVMRQRTEVAGATRHGDHSPLLVERTNHVKHFAHRLLEVSRTRKALLGRLTRELMELIADPREGSDDSIAQLRSSRAWRNTLRCFANVAGHW